MLMGGRLELVDASDRSLEILMQKKEGDLGGWEGQVILYYRMDLAVDDGDCESCD